MASHSPLSSASRSLQARKGQGDKGKGSRVKLWGILETTHRETACTITAVGRITHVGRTEDLVKGARVARSRRPVAAVISLIEDRPGWTVTAATCHWQFKSISKEISFTTCIHCISWVDLYPCIVQSLSLCSCW